MIDDRLDASCCRMALIRSELTARAVRIEIRGLNDGRCHQGCELVRHIARRGSRRRPVHRQPAGNGGRLSGGRQPRASICCWYFSIPFAPRLRNGISFGPIRLPKSSTDSWVFWAPSSMLANWVATARKASTGRISCPGFNPTFFRMRDSVRALSESFGGLACPLANDLAVVAEARDDLDCAA